MAPDAAASTSSTVAVAIAATLAVLVVGAATRIALDDQGDGVAQLATVAPVKAWRDTPPRTSRSHRRHRLHVRPAATISATHRWLNWPALAQCEATGNPRAVSPNGLYFGLYQFDLPTWRSVGGVGNPADATVAEQTYRAWLLYRERGTAPWPVCGFHLVTP